MIRAVELKPLQHTGEELLPGASGRGVPVDLVPHQVKMGREQAGKFRRVIALRIQAATPLRAFRSERAYNQVSARLNRARRLRHVSGTTISLSEKVKDGAIMPKAILRGRKGQFTNIADQPLHLLRRFSQSLLRNGQSASRDIQNADLAVSAHEKIVD